MAKYSYDLSTLKITAILKNCFNTIMNEINYLIRE